jgi:hypothetical protein
MVFPSILTILKIVWTPTVTGYINVVFARRAR